MTLKLELATEKDADSIGDVHMAAFATNPNLLKHFPTPASKIGLHACVARKATEDMRDPHTVVLVVKDTDLGDKVISYGKWSLPSSSSETEAPWIWPEETRVDIVDSWTELVEGTKEDLLGDKPHYGLSYTATHPLHQRRGASKMMVQWGVDRAKEENLPIYLESTEEASHMYEKLGFKCLRKFSFTFEDGSSYGESVYMLQPDENRSTSTRTQ